MKCVDCIEREEKKPNDAEVYLILNNNRVLPLCRSCYDEYAYAEGDMNLDSHYVEIRGTGQVYFIKRINEVLKYLNDMNTRYRERYFAAKKLGEDARKRNVKIAPEKLLEAIEW